MWECFITLLILIGDKTRLSTIQSLSKAASAAFFYYLDFKNILYYNRNMEKELKKKIIILLEIAEEYFSSLEKITDVNDDIRTYLMQIIDTLKEED